MLTELAHDTAISGTITWPVSDENESELCHDLETAAAKAAASGTEQQVALNQAQLRVHPPSSRRGSLHFNAPASDIWPRIAGKLRRKAEQAQASGGGWLRADILDGTIRADSIVASCCRGGEVEGLRPGRRVRLGEKLK